MNGQYGIYNRATRDLLRKGIIVDDRFEPPATTDVDAVLYILIDGEKSMRSWPPIPPLPLPPSATYSRLTSAP